MQITNVVFDKRHRTLLSGLIRGLLPDTVPVAGYTRKVQYLLRHIGIELNKSTIAQQMWWATNNQDTFRAVYQVLLNERPNQLKDLFNGQKIDESFDGKVEKLETA